MYLGQHQTECFVEYKYHKEVAGDFSFGRQGKTAKVVGL
jgi:hypothetical protein